jgi:hypothetical protein
MQVYQVREVIELIVQGKHTIVKGHLRNAQTTTLHSFVLLAFRVGTDSETTYGNIYKCRGCANSIQNVPTVTLSCSTCGKWLHSQMLFQHYCGICGYEYPKTLLSDQRVCGICHQAGEAINTDCPCGYKRTIAHYYCEHNGNRFSTLDAQIYLIVE